MNAQKEFSLLGRLKYNGIPIHDVWRYTDTVTNKPYALLCANTSGMRIIDISDVQNPTEVASISGSITEAIDVKTWKNYAYAVSEFTSDSGIIFDLTDPTTPIKVGTFPGGHNIFISDSGYMYLSTPGIRIFDLNTSPINPVLVYSDNVCNGHDIAIVRNKLYDFTWNCGTKIYDISRPDTLVLLGSVPPNGINHHSGWVSEDDSYLFVCDELASTSSNDITVWDISNLSAPIMVDSFADPDAYVHNLYIIDTIAYVSYYRAGIRAFSVADPTNIKMIAEYDTDSSWSGPGYGGNFGLYVFTSDSSILASDERKGLYIFKLKDVSNNTLSVPKIKNKEIKIYPNPIQNDLTVLIEQYKNKNLIIYNTLGQVELTQKMNNKENIIHLHNLRKGIHFLQINDESGNIVLFKKIKKR